MYRQLPPRKQDAKTRTNCGSLRPGFSNPLLGTNPNMWHPGPGSLWGSPEVAESCSSSGASQEGTTKKHLGREDSVRAPTANHIARIPSPGPIQWKKNHLTQVDLHTYALACIPHAHTLSTQSVNI